ncbi:hypothetical protein AGMMS49525_18130 [Bacteroidia bacterium]|nr:hypothetical protein AGMMS49525_18130 [Bacteroidia bacterium]
MLKSPQFRLLFNVEEERTLIAHSSLSDRLAVMKVDYFRQIHEVIFERFSQLYPSKTLAGLTLQRVDSSLVLETANKLKEGMTCSNGYKEKKMLKYTIKFRWHVWHLYRNAYGR